MLEGIRPPLTRTGARPGELLLRAAPYGLLLAAEAWLALRVILPYSRNPLTLWDTPGHLLSAWFARKHLLPDCTGWNPFFFLGYPQGEGYPPAFAWLVAVLGSLVPLSAAFRAVVLASVAAVPPAAYALGRSLGLDRIRASVTSLAVMGLLAYGRQMNGGNLYSTFYGGLVAHALALPLFLAFLAALCRGLRTGRGAVPGVLLAALALTHTMAFVASFLAAVSFSLAAPPLRRSLRVGARALLVAGALSAFWVTPFLLSRHLQSARTLGLDPFTPAEEGVIGGAVLAFLLAPRGPLHGSLRPLAAFLVLTLAIRIPLALGAEEWIPLHYYRLKPHLLILVPYLAWPLLERLPALLRRLAMTVGAGALFLAPLDDLRLPGAPVEPPPDLPPGEGRVSMLVSEDRMPFHHAPAHLLVLGSGRPVVKGLFVESTPLARSIFEMEQLLLGPTPARPAVTWGGIEWSRSEILAGKGLARRAERLRLLGIDTICADGPILEEGLPILERTSSRGFTVHRLAPAPLVEVVREPPLVAPSRGWQALKASWFLGGETRLLLDRPLEAPPGGPGVEVEEILLSARQDEIRFRAKGGPAPFLVKVPWHRNWRAWAEGRPVPIAEAAPGLMVVCGRGEIVLRHRRSAPDRAAAALTAAAVGFLLLSRARGLLGRRVRREGPGPG